MRTKLTDGVSPHFQLRLYIQRSQWVQGREFILDAGVSINSKILPKKKTGVTIL